MAQDTTGTATIAAATSTVDGLRAIELSYRPIRSTADGDVLFFQSAMRLNGPTLGVLAPEDFMPVAESTGQAFPLFKLALVQLAQAIAKFRAREISFSWCSLAIPAAALGRLDCVKTICDLCETLKADPAKICFEIPQNALGDTAAAVLSLHGVRVRRRRLDADSRAGGGLCNAQPRRDGKHERRRARADLRKDPAGLRERH